MMSASKRHNGGQGCRTSLAVVLGGRNILAVSVACILVLGACSPTTPDEGGSGPPPAGETSDTFSISINQVASDGRPGLPISDCTVRAEFVDTDNIDIETGQYTIRATRVGVTNTNGFWSVTVSYHGEGNLAANGINYRITHPDYDPFLGVTPLHNHNAATTVQLTER